jgi:hypothetical protein
MIVFPRRSAARSGAAWRDGRAGAAATQQQKNATYPFEQLALV